MKTTLRGAVSKFGNYELRHVRRTLEAELMAAIEVGESGNQSHLGKLEILEAVGAELDSRKNPDGTSALLSPPPFIDICTEGTERLTFQVRVF